MGQVVFGDAFNTGKVPILAAKGAASVAIMRAAYEPLLNAVKVVGMAAVTVGNR